LIVPDKFDRAGLLTEHGSWIWSCRRPHRARQLTGGLLFYQLIKYEIDGCTCWDRLPCLPMISEKRVTTGGYPYGIRSCRINSIVPDKFDRADVLTEHGYIIWSCRRPRRARQLTEGLLVNHLTEFGSCCFRGRGNSLCQDNDGLHVV